MRIARNFVLLVAVACIVACGGGGGGGGGVPAATYTASGTWSYDDPTDTLTLNFTSSSYPPACGPSVGTQVVHVDSLGVLQMLWESGMAHMAWLRTSGGAGLVGTWVMTNDEGTYTLTMNAAGGFTVTSDTLDCGGTGDYGFATGTWAYNAATQVFSIVVTTEDFPTGCGPPVGASSFDVLALTSSTMTWDDTPPIVWTRMSPGTGLVGGWTMERDGGTYQMLLNPDNTFTLMAAGLNCVSCSGGDYEARGTWTFDDPTDTLGTVFTESCFPAGCGPAVGPMTFTVLSLTPTQMVWDGGPDPDLVWTRTPAGVGLVGTWTMSRDGGTYELSVNGDGTFELVALGISCL